MDCLDHQARLDPSDLRVQRDLLENMVHLV